MSGYTPRAFETKRTFTVIEGTSLVKCDQCHLKFYYHMDWCLHICNPVSIPKITEEEDGSQQERTERTT